MFGRFLLPALLLIITSAYAFQRIPAGAFRRSSLTSSISARSAQDECDIVPLTSQTRAQREVKTAALVFSAGLGLLSGLILQPRPSFAAAGSVQKSSVEEAITAAKEIKTLKAKVAEIEVLADKNDWEGVGTVLEDKLFAKFDQTAGVLVRSDGISAEDKVALGTIKRYGLVADAIIMIGGLKAVLKAGGVKAIKAEAGAYSDQKPIEEDDGEEDDEDTGKSVDKAEANKFIKLVKGSIEDINRISAVLLK